jgi:cysteine desulfurase
MLPYFGVEYGNPSTVYGLGGRAKKAVRQSRDIIAKAINSSAEEIFFTSGGTESDNWALIGAAEMLKDKGNHIITTSIEHHAVLENCEYLRNNGYEITYIQPDNTGRIDPETIKKAIRPETILISVMMSNNEIGIIEPVAKIGAIARDNGILFHTDAVQAFGHIAIDVDAMNIDMLSASGHKLNGPKGIGFLYIRQGIKMDAYIRGGGQERRRRSGTENVPGIAGFGKATELAIDNMVTEQSRITELKNHMAERILAEIPGAVINGGIGDEYLPGILNVRFDGKQSETTMIMLDMQNIYCSAGSACSTGSIDVSHVLKAIGISDSDAQTSLRFSIGRYNTLAEIDAVVDALLRIMNGRR